MSRTSVSTLGASRLPVHSNEALLSLNCGKLGQKPIISFWHLMRHVSFLTLLTFSRSAYSNRALYDSSEGPMRNVGGLPLCDPNASAIPPQEPPVYVNPHPHDLVFQCRTANEPETLIKFCTSYCTELHKQLAHAGLAPDLLDVSPLPGGWLMVTMRYLGNSWSTLWSILDSGNDAKIRAALSAIMPRIDELHQLPGGPWVWAECRPANILVMWYAFACPVLSGMAQKTMRRSG